MEEVGAFCSFAEGTDAVENHGLYVSTHPFLTIGMGAMGKNHYWKYGYPICGDLLGQIDAEGEIHKCKKVVIGNDVWFGKNVIVCNGARIGNGVIAGAGAVITSDVPDYAIVVGVPAKIIRFRFDEEQIKSLNKIQWWNWSDKKIAERVQDFYDIDAFIQKWG